MTGRVAAIGDLLLDVSCRVLGPVNEDTDTPSANRLEAGGQAANVAAWAAAGGVASRLIVRRSTDPAGRLAAQRLVERGVEVVGPSGPEPAGIVVVLVTPDGARTMLTDRGAATLLAANDVPPSLLDGVAWLHVAGYSLLAEPMLGAARAAATAVRARGGRVSTDLASTSGIAAIGVRPFLDHVRAIAPDILFATRDELDLTGGPAGALGAGLGTLVVEKRGPAGAALHGAAVAERSAHPTEAIDTTGAGDALAGGMLAALVQGASVVAALDAGLAAAAACVGRRGAMPPA
jgi:sugar/nucleoside kinase (ribokinase family)